MHTLQRLTERAKLIMVEHAGKHCLQRWHAVMGREVPDLTEG